MESDQERHERIWELAEKVYNYGLDQTLAINNQHISVPLVNAISTIVSSLWGDNKFNMLRRIASENPGKTVAELGHQIIQAELELVEEVVAMIFTAGYEHGKNGGLIERFTGICQCGKHKQN